MSDSTKGKLETIETIGLIASVLVPTAIDLAKAFFAGDAPAYERVADIIPADYRAKALLAHEVARLHAMGGGDAG